MDSAFFRESTTSERWDDDELMRRRELVLQSWPTGSQVRDLDACVEYSRSLPPERRFTEVARKARVDGLPRFQIGVGHTAIPEQLEHLKAVCDAGVDLVLSHLDSYTRKSRYDKVEIAIERAAKGESSGNLNGFPITNYGLRTREVFSEVPVPIQVNANNDEENVLSSEIAFASGATCDNSHSLHELVQHSREYPFAQRLQTNQYVARLAAHYTSRGAPIELISYSVYQGLIPPGLGIATSVLNVLVSAAQGAKYFSLNRGTEGCLVQDVAAFQVYRRVADYYLKKLGHDDVDCVTHSWPWMGGWPHPEHENSALVSWSTAIGILSGVEWIYLKSIHEGSGVPNIQANVASIELARQLRRMVPQQAILQSAEIEEEAHYIEMEARALIDAALDLGGGDPARAQLEAVKEGYLDLPMSAWSGVAGKLLACRDLGGAVRYLDHGRLPLPDEALRRNQLKVTERKKKSGITDDIDLVIHDIRQFLA